ncbi:Hypothetical_protein [Hexamita inflata]|uniref:Hypothetical_protein n=1 Tax=Hexamita inflata TaxID=28002 RepID=A0AA86UIE8_9EUKA|nr:Hypothetical protein HINF_LOCUS40381 [Hexamita inflata]
MMLDTTTIITFIIKQVGSTQLSLPTPNAVIISTQITLYCVRQFKFNLLTYDQNWNLNCFYIPLPICFFHSCKFSLNNFPINTRSQTCLNSNKQLKVTQNNGQNRNYKLNILQFFTENFISYFKEYKKQQRIRERKGRKVRRKTRFELRGCFYRKRHLQWFASYNKNKSDEFNNKIQWNLDN